MREALSRRELLLLSGGLLLGSCSAASPSGAGSPGQSRGATPPRATPPGPRRSRLPQVTPWSPNANDVVPAAKVAAVREIEARGNSPRTALRVIDAQYGGIPDHEGERPGRVSIVGSNRRGGHSRRVNVRRPAESHREHRLASHGGPSHTSGSAGEPAVRRCTAGLGNPDDRASSGGPTRRDVGASPRQRS